MKIKDKPYLSHEKFRKFFKELEELGFEEKNPNHMMREIKESGSVPYLKKKFEGRERVYEKEMGVHRIFVDTSFVNSINDINEEDFKWIGLKTKGNPIKFFWFPVLRSLNSCDTVISDVKMLIELVVEWPSCEECKERLMLVRYPQVMHLMQFVCSNSKFRHRKQNIVPYAVFDVPTMSDENSLRMFNRYKQFYEYEYRQQMKDPNVKHEYRRVLRARARELAQLSYHQKTISLEILKNFLTIPTMTVLIMTENTASRSMLQPCTNTCGAFLFLAFQFIRSTIKMYEGHISRRGRILADRGRVQESQRGNASYSRIYGWHRAVSNARACCDGHHRSRGSGEGYV